MTDKSNEQVTLSLCFGTFVGPAGSLVYETDINGKHCLVVENPSGNVSKGVIQAGNNSTRNSLITSILEKGGFKSVQPKEAFC